MAEEVIFPRWYYAASTPEGRVFNDQAALDAASAEGPWFMTPTEAAEAAATAPPVSLHRAQRPRKNLTRRRSPLRSIARMAEHQTHAVTVTLETPPWRPCLFPCWRCAMAPRCWPASVASRSRTSRARWKLP